MISFLPRDAMQCAAERGTLP